MRTLALLVEPRGSRLVADVPESRRERMLGLLGREALPRGRSLLLEDARSIHTFGMRGAIRVALLGADLEVVDVLLVRPRRLVLPRRGVRHVLECGVGTDLRPGDVLRAVVDGSGPEAGRSLRRGSHRGRLPP